jgi:hypothetical protein
MRLVTLRTLLVVAILVAAVTVGGTAIAASTGAVGSPSTFLDSLAQHLGISREKLDDAVEAAALDQVDAALKAGDLTDEQADALKERIESGSGLFFGLGHGLRGHGHDGPHGFGHLSAAAEYLGLEEDEFREQLRDGKTLAEIAKAEGKTVDGLEQAILADAKERVAAAVKDGKLTEAQATEALEALEDRIDALVDGTGFGGHGLRGFFGRGSGMWGPPSGMRRDHAEGHARLAPAWGAPA